LFNNGRPPFLWHWVRPFLNEKGRFMLPIYRVIFRFPTFQPLNLFQLLIYLMVRINPSTYQWTFFFFYKTFCVVGYFLGMGVRLSFTFYQLIVTVQNIRGMALYIDKQRGRNGRIAQVVIYYAVPFAWVSVLAAKFPVSCLVENNSNSTIRNKWLSFLFSPNGGGR